MNSLHDAARHVFASDNSSGVHPEVMAALLAVNGGHTDAYGADPYTEAFGAWARALFGEGAVALPVLNGTGANVLALQAATPRFGAVLCAASAHINTDEAAAPERSAGLKLLPLPHEHGKVSPAAVHAAAGALGSQHHAQPTTLSLSNVTEAGTAYTPAEIAALSAAVHEHGMLVHVDGSRLSHAAAFTGAGLRELVSEAGVDVLSLGATKNGAMLAEAVIALHPAAAAALPHLRKSTTQLVSKQRFVSAQLLAMYEGDLWLRNAGHANALAARLGSGLAALPGVRLAHPVESNAVFIEAPATLLAPLRERFGFHGEGTAASPARLMCSFDTREEHVDALLAAAAELA
ncbi:threonine aldolase family protein [Galactobacter valiniphilus]|uniref:threonine aldolase family protein n=1 Tax=Galactobacter valiniphilus TaxID=2676122 RepID=UPI003735896E